MVFVGASIDGYIADRNGGLDWLQMVPNPENLDLGWSKLLERVDGIVMGRKTFETVAGFDCSWPYSKIVFVLSRSMESLPEEYEGRVEIVGGKPVEVDEQLRARGFENLYIDGGSAIHGFLEEDLIDEITITRIPVLLGGGTPLFRELSSVKRFTHFKTDILLEQMVQSCYVRRR